MDSFSPFNSFNHLTYLTALWLLLQSDANDAAYNMALDEALLEAMPRLAAPVLRFYSWTEPAASFGYFQKYSDVERLTSLRPLIRRPTAGGLVPHDSDWTYSLAFATTHEWYSFTAIQSYERIHRWIQSAFTKLNVPTLLAPERRKAEPGQCFVGHEKSDLLWHGKKIAGAAQRRARDGLLIQGSIQPPPLALQRSQWENAMRETAASVRWNVFAPDQMLTERVQELISKKYSVVGYNQKR